MFEKIKSILKRFEGNSEMNSAEEKSSAHVTQFKILANFNLGMGKIGPANRTDIDQKVLNEMYRRVAAGEFNIPVDGSLPEICVDGRTNKDGKRKTAPSAAGGTLSMVYGFDLGNSESSNKKTELELTAEIVDALKQKGYSVGVHGDNHSDCGCGACAQARNIYQYIVEQIDPIAALTSQYGISITDAEKSYIVEKAKNRLDQPNFFAQDRSAVLQTAQNHGADYEELVDAHNELGIALNVKSGTTVNRAAIRAAFGPQYDLFIVDAWTFDPAARELKSEANDQETALISKAITIQNVATASVLGHSSLPVIPIS